MNKIRTSLILALVAIGLITLVFISLLASPKGLGLLNMPLLLAGLGSWLVGAVLLITGVVKKTTEVLSKKTVITTAILLIAFLPVSWNYMQQAGKVRTQITVHVVNNSDKVAEQIAVYGSGTIFEKADTLKIGQLKPGEAFNYLAQPVTKPHRVGHIRMDFYIGNQSYSKTIAGEFSVNPYQLQQNWEVTLDSLLVE